MIQRVSQLAEFFFGKMLLDQGSVMGLGIEGLPPPLQRFPPYQPQVFLVSDAGLRTRMAFQVIQSSLSCQGKLHVVLGPDAGPEFDQHLSQCAEAMQALRSGRLALLQWGQGFKDRAVLAPLLKELRRFNVAEQDGLIFLGMDALFHWEQSVLLQRELEAVQAWVRQRPCGALFLFSCEGGAALPVSSMSWIFPNVAKLSLVQDHLSLDVLRWQGDVDCCCYGLRLASGERLQVETMLDADQQRLLAGPRQGSVLVMANGVGEQQGIPESWRILPDSEALEREAPLLGAATLVLAYSSQDEFIPLVRRVDALRRVHPRHLKILVREMGGKLRYGAESILLQAGANAVIYRELGFSRVIQQVHGYETMVYSRPFCDDIEALLAAADPDEVAGYLPPEAFCTHARRMVERSAPLGIEHCLVRFSLLRYITHLDALQACRIGRHGDLVSTDRGHLYLFLFACREPDVEASIAHLFSEPIDTLFASTNIYPGSELVLHTLEQLHYHAEHEGLPDYSTLLPPQLPVPRQADDNQEVPGNLQPAAVASCVMAESPPSWPLPRQVSPFPIQCRVSC